MSDNDNQKAMNNFGTTIPADWKAPELDTRRTTDDVALQGNKFFTDFHLTTALLRGIYEAGYNKPSPIQWETIPAILLGKHVLARAKNGTGKTASYLLPILDNINTNVKEPQAVILVPNRELALQVSTNMQKLGKYLDVKVLCLVGGTSTQEDILRIKQGCHAIVATPGRLLDIVSRLDNLLQNAQYLVLDEADKLLSDDFITTVKEIITKAPATIQKLLFSATFPTSLAKFISTYIDSENLHRVNLMENLTLKGITQYYVYIQETEKIRSVYALLKKLQINQCIIFCNSVKRVEFLAKSMSEHGLPTYYIHSKMSQDERNQVFSRFFDGKVKHLVASDIFTRGIDVPSVNVVINFDLPNTPETYLHRIGRSGRFGHYGLAINLVTEADKEIVYKIEHKLDTEITSFPKGDVDPALYTQ